MSTRNARRDSCDGDGQRPTGRSVLSKMALDSHCVHAAGLPAVRSAWPARERVGCCDRARIWYDSDPGVVGLEQTRLVLACCRSGGRFARGPHFPRTVDREELSGIHAAPARFAGLFLFLRMLSACGESVLWLGWARYDALLIGASN